jgi:hypothetical protein
VAAIASLEGTALPEMTAAAPTTALRIMKVRRSTPAGVSGGVISRLDGREG